MAYTFQAQGTTAVGSSSLSVAYPTSPAAGDLLILCLSAHNTNARTVPAGWVQIPNAAIGISSIVLDVYYKIAVGGETGSISVTLSAAEDSVGVMVSYRPGYNTSTPDFSPATATGLGNGTSGAISKTLTQTPELTTGDTFLVIQASGPTSAVTFSSTSITSSQYSFGTATELVDTARDSTPTNSQYAHLLVNRVAASGNSPDNTTAATITYATTASATLTASVVYAISCIRIREHQPVTFRGRTTPVAQGSTSLSVNYPPYIVAGDKLMLLVVNKYPPNNPTSPSGWDLSSSISTTSGTTGAGVGDITTSVYTKIADGTETGAVSVTITSGNAACGRIFNFGLDAKYTWDEAIQSVTSAGVGTTTITFTLANDTFRVGDLVIGIMGHAQNGRTFSAELFNTSPSLFVSGSVVEWCDSGTTLGDTCGLVVFQEYVGTSGTTTSFTMTTTASTAATSVSNFALVVYRLRANLTVPDPGGMLGFFGLEN